MCRLHDGGEAMLEVTNRGLLVRRHVPMQTRPLVHQEMPPSVPIQGSRLMNRHLDLPRLP